MYWVSELLAGFCAAIIFHVTNNEEADLRFLHKDTVERHAAAVGGHASSYHEKVSLPWRKEKETSASFNPPEESESDRIEKEC